MRKDEYGNDCPSTLGEYRDLCAALGGDCDAVRLLDQKIEPDARKFALPLLHGSLAKRRREP